MSDEVSPERKALDSAMADMQRLAVDHRSSALEHVRAALTDYRWIFAQGMSSSLTDRNILNGLEAVEKELKPYVEGP